MILEHFAELSLDLFGGVETQEVANAQMRLGQFFGGANMSLELFCDCRPSKLWLPNECGAHLGSQTKNAIVAEISFGVSDLERQT